MMEWLKKHREALGVVAALVAAAAAAYGAFVKPAPVPAPAPSVSITGVVHGDVNGDGVAVGSGNSVTIERTRSKDGSVSRREADE